VRAFNRVLSAFLAAVLVVAGVLTILEICRAALSQPPAVVQWPKLLPKLRNNSYNDVGPILVCVGLAVVGLLILISGIKRGKPYALPAGSTAPGIRTEIHRRSLQRAMQAAVAATDRVERGEVTLRRRSARITARASTQSTEGLEADIRQRVEALLNSIALVEPPRLRIKTYPAAAPAAPKSAAQTPIGVAAGPEQQTATIAADPVPPTQASAPPAAEPVPPTAEPIPPAPEPARPAPTTESAPIARPSPEPEPTESPTTHLDDLLSDPEDDEPR
jgi:hypothetical protein